MRAMALQIEYNYFIEDRMATLYAKGYHNAKELSSLLNCSLSTVYRVFNSIAFDNALANHRVKKAGKLSEGIL